MNTYSYIFIFLIFPFIPDFLCSQLVSLQMAILYHLSSLQWFCVFWLFIEKVSIYILEKSVAKIITYLCNLKAPNPSYVILSMDLNSVFINLYEVISTQVQHVSYKWVYMLPLISITIYLGTARYSLSDLVSETQLNTGCIFCFSNPLSKTGEFTSG